MSLGNNRDYKSTGDRVKRNLAHHARLTALYVSFGLNSDEASKLALTMVLSAKLRQKVGR